MRGASAFCGKKSKLLLTKKFDLSKSYRNLLRFKKRATKREKFLQELHDMAEYATRLLDCFSCFKEIQNYSEQISSLHAESVQLYKLWKQLNEDSPYKEHISDALRSNKIFLHK